MLPQSAYSIAGELEVTPARDLPSLTYAVDFDTGAIAGKVDGRDAVRQAVRLLLQTERFAHVIYSWNYGVELAAVYGLDYRQAASELRRVLEEALLSDSRITAVRDISVTRSGPRALTVSIAVSTAFGDIDLNEEVSVRV